MFFISYIFIVFHFTFASPTTSGSLILGTPGPVIAGQPFQLDLLFTDAKGAVIEEVSLNHEKLNHTIIVSQDLATLAHVHPAIATGGRFSLQVNGSGYDADNLDARKAVPTPGVYFVISEILPKGATQSLIARAEFKTEGTPQTTPLVVDDFQQGVSTKYFKADSSLGTKGDTYKVTYAVHKMSGAFHFLFYVEEAMNHGGTTHYMPAQNLENWLGMAGHGILISEAGATATEKYFKHLHLSGHDHNTGTTPQAPHEDHSGHKTAAAINGDHLMFELTETLSPGVYKIWAQFKHKGQVLTFPFVFLIP